MLLDEPTTYLDVRFQLEILQLMKTLNGTYGKTIIMVLHDINQAIHYSDNLVALREGTVLASGAPCEVLSEQLIEQVYGVHLRLAHIDALPFVVTV
ncbi:ABC transporter ATPase [Chlamydia trachomatis]|nr:ABC transporter ATPase [Chlamydia trachomatis]